MKKNVIILLVWLIPLEILAQKPPVKFGKIDSKIVSLETSSNDSEAIVLLDYGETNFRYTSDNGFVYIFDRVTRIKILSKDGLDYGNFVIPFYKNSGNREKVSQVKGYTYNYTDGSVEKSKLSKSSIFEEEESEHWSNMKISMADVRVGSVVEISYTVTSPFLWNLVTWEFQDKIPTAYSEYRANIPDYFDYQLLQYGYHPLSTNEHSQSPGSISVQTKTRSGGDGSKSSFSSTETTYSTEKFNFKYNNYRWIAEEVPVFEVESYVGSPSDYVSKMKFELRGTKYPNRSYKPVMGTWNSLNKTFIEKSDFGIAIKSTGFMKDELAQLSSLQTDNEKITAIVSLVRKQIEWNGNYSRYVNSTLKKAWTDKKGATADINLTIVAGLRKLGYDADPILISTRGHGKIRKQYAISSQFNSVIASVRLDNKVILLDGTDRYLPIGILPKKNLNEFGYQISETHPGWVSLTPPTNQEQIYKAKLKITGSGEVKGKVSLVSNGYAGYQAHKEFIMKGSQEFVKDLVDNNEQWSISDYKVINESNYSEPFESIYEIEFAESLLLAGDRIYFNPTMEEIVNENPFKMENREYPVDYGYPIQKDYSFSFEIPENFIVEELPDPASYNLGNNSATFKYEITKEGENSILIKAGFRIDKTQFVQSEYSDLKKFYDQVVKKCAEQVVIKKTSEP